MKRYRIKDWSFFEQHIKEGRDEFKVPNKGNPRNYNTRMKKYCGAIIDNLLVSQDGKTILIKDEGRMWHFYEDWYEEYVIESTLKMKKNNSGITLST